MVKAYRDTWTLGVHSYLAYLRDRLIVAKNFWPTPVVFSCRSATRTSLGARCLDEVFGRRTSAVITFKKTGGQTTRLSAGICDYLLWYAKRSRVGQVPATVQADDAGEGHQRRAIREHQACLETGKVIRRTERSDEASILAKARWLRARQLSLESASEEHERSSRSYFEARVLRLRRTHLEDDSRGMTD